MATSLNAQGNNRLLITGARGFIGRAVCAGLSERQERVRGVVRNMPECGFGQYELIELGDIGPATDWSGALKGVQVVIHLAARQQVRHYSAADGLAAFRAVNVEGTLNLARQAVAVGVKRFLFVSSVKVNGECTQTGRAFTEVDPPKPQDAYAQSKYEAELGLREIAAATNMQIVIIRPPLVYGPEVKANFAALMRAVQRGWPLPLAAVHNKRSLVALDNLVDFILTCVHHLQAANQTFLVSDGHDLSTAELVRGLALAAGVPARLLPVPVWMLRAGAALLGKGDAVQRLCGNLQVDISKAHNLLGWMPPVSVEESLRRAVAAVRLPCRRSRVPTLDSGK